MSEKFILIWNVLNIQNRSSGRRCWNLYGDMDLFKQDGMAILCAVLYTNSYTPPLYTISSLVLMRNYCITQLKILTD